MAYKSQLLERQSGVFGPELHIRRMRAADEASRMALLAVRNGEAGIEDVRRMTHDEVATALGNQAADRVIDIIVPPQVPETEPASTA